MWVGKKTAGKKNKFWDGRFSFIQFALEENLIFVTSLAAVHITEKGFAKAGLFSTTVHSENHTSIIRKNCQPKHRTPAFAKPLLAVVLIVNVEYFG